jgi:hypothetical protein
VNGFHRSHASFAAAGLERLAQLSRFYRKHHSPQTKRPRAGNPGLASIAEPDYETCTSTAGSVMAKVEQMICTF